MTVKEKRAINNFVFNIGDELKYTAYSDYGGRSIIDSPTANKTYTFQYSGSACVELVLVCGGVEAGSVAPTTVRLLFAACTALGIVETTWAYAW